jgi:hypothetical protein
MIPNIPENPQGRKLRFNPAIFEERFRTIERVFAWEDKSGACCFASSV